MKRGEAISAAIDRGESGRGMKSCGESLLIHGAGSDCRFTPVELRDGSGNDGDGMENPIPPPLPPLLGD